MPHLIDRKTSNTTPQELTELSNFTKVSNKLLQKQLRGEANIKDMLDLMSNKNKLKKVINEK